MIPIQTGKDFRGGINNKHAAYDVVTFDDGAVWIVDRSAEENTKSITNDADWVAGELALHYGGRRIFYRDSMGNWDEIVHDCGAFVCFKTARERGINLGGE